MSFLIIMLGIALNIVPSDVRSFTMTPPPDQRSIEYVRQPDNGWTVATTNKINKAEVFVAGTQLTVASQGHNMTMSLINVLGVTKDTEWKTVDHLSFGRGIIKIERQTNGVNLVLNSGEQQATNDVRQIYQVRWNQKSR